MTYVRHIVIWRAITVARHHWRELLVWDTIHVWHRRRESLLLYRAVELGTCWHVMRLSPRGLVRVPVGRRVSDVVGPGVKGIRISPFLCLLCAVDPISHRHGAGTRDTGTIVVLCIVVSTVKTPEPEGVRPYLEWRSLWMLSRRSSPEPCCKPPPSPLSTSWHAMLALCCLRVIILLGLLFFGCLLVLGVASSL